MSKCDEYLLHDSWFRPKEHIPPNDCVAAFRNIASCVKPGGVLILTTPSTNIENTNPQHYRHFTVDVLSELVTQAGGLQILAAEGYGDYVLAGRYHQIARFVDNRYYLIRPLRRWLQVYYGRRCRSTSIKRCEGIVMAMERTGVG